MKSISIRELSATSIATSMSEDTILGITNYGNLVGVLVPISDQSILDMTRRDQAEAYAAAVQAEAELGPGQVPRTLSDVLKRPIQKGRSANLRRTTIRELSGALLEEARNADTVLIVTSDRVAVALIVPVSQYWIEDLVEKNISQFLNRDIADNQSVEPLHVDDDRKDVIDMPRKISARLAPTDLKIGRELRPRHGKDALLQRAIGIKIVPDSADASSHLVGVITDILGRVINRPVRVPLHTMNEAEVFAHIITLVDQLRAEMSPGEEFLGVGLEIGGHVHNGRIVYSANAHWDHFPLAAQVEEILGYPVTIENDADALAVHERWFRGIDDDNFAVILVTHLGVGCGLVLNGSVYHGIHGMAGELGHIPVETSVRETPKCRCDNPGCLEGVATPNAIALTLPEFGFNDGYNAALDNPRAESVVAVFEQAGAAMGRAVATLLNICNLSAVIFHAPAYLLGPPRQFRIESVPPSDGVARPYVRAMIAAIDRHTFSTASQDCRFIVRTSEDQDGAAAAAGCLIRHVKSLTAASQVLATAGLSIR